MACIMNLFNFSAPKETSEVETGKTLGICWPPSMTYTEEEYQRDPVPNKVQSKERGYLRLPLEHLSMQITAFPHTNIHTLMYIYIHNIYIIYLNHTHTAYISYTHASYTWQTLTYTKSKINMCITEVMRKKHWYITKSSKNIPLFL